MKKIDLSNIVDGVRKLGAVKQLFEHMESGYVTALSDLLYGLLASSNGPTALYGCVNSGSGSTYTISAGAIFHNGEVYTIPAFSGVAPGVQVPVLSLVNTITQLAYTDNTNQNTLQTRTYAWSFGASGSGLADFSAVTTLKNRINTNLLDVPGQVTAAVNAVINAAPGALDTLDELAAALGDDANFAATMTTALAGKLSTAAGAVGDASLASKFLKAIDGVQILSKVIDIGDWNMDTTSTKNVNHGIADSTKILWATAKIFGDVGSGVADTHLQTINASGTAEGAVTGWTSSQINLFRVTGSNFDTALYDATSYNRGRLTIFYEA